MIVFEGLNLNLYEEFEKKTNEVCLSKLSIEYTYKCYDQILKMQIGDVSIADFALNEDPQQAMLILSSRAELL